MKDFISWLEKLNKEFYFMLCIIDTLGKLKGMWP